MFVQKKLLVSRSHDSCRKNRSDWFVHHSAICSIIICLFSVWRFFRIAHEPYQFSLALRPWSSSISFVFFYAQIENQQTPYLFQVCWQYRVGLYVNIKHLKRSQTRSRKHIVITATIFRLIIDELHNARRANDMTVCFRNSHINTVRFILFLFPSNVCLLLTFFLIFNSF